MATAVPDLESGRTGARKRVLMRGTLYSPHGAHVIWIKDLSSSGALVSSQDRLPTECDVILKRGGIFVAGRVAWLNETGAGVEFYRELADREMSSAAAAQSRID